ATYQLLENWLRNRGEDKRARQVYLAMRRRDRREGMARDWFPVRWLWDWFQDKSVGYGLYSRRVFFYFLVMVLVCWGVFSIPGALQRTGDHTAPADAAAPAFWLSLQTNLPMFPVLPARGWAPSPRFPALFGHELRISVLGADVGLTYEVFA